MGIRNIEFLKPWDKPSEEEEKPPLQISEPIEEKI